MDGIEPVDIIAGTILAIAAIRGFFLGLIREAFSLGAIACAYLAVRIFTTPATAWLVEVGNGEISESIAPFLAGGAIVILTIGGVTTIGRVVRRGVRAVGLGLADRVSGAALGAAEGALISALLMVLVGRAVGFDHPALAETRSVAALAQLQQIAGADSGDPDVAAPPPGR